MMWPGPNEQVPLETRLEQYRLITQNMNSAALQLILEMKRPHPLRKPRAEGTPALPGVPSGGHSPEGPLPSVSCGRANGGRSGERSLTLASHRLWQEYLQSGREERERVS